MDCECNKLIEIYGFGGYLHYSDTLNKMKMNTENGYFNMTSENQFEIIFQCKKCKQIWKLAEPDYPAQGYFIRSKSI